LIATAGKDGVLRVLDRQSRERLYETSVTTIANADRPVTSQGTHTCPGLLGGVEWNGPAYHPRTNLLYTPAVDWCGTYTLAESIRYVPGTSHYGGSYTADSTSQGWLTAVDASSGAVRWRYRSAQPLVGAVTTTGGGLVLMGELTGDLVALDAADGTELFRTNVGAPIGGGIVSYEVDRKQYVAVASGRPSRWWATAPSEAMVTVFALP
jgi:alcohol dehydrogenase (cytochrome c)